MQEEDCVTCPRPGRVSNWAHSWTQLFQKPKPSIHTKQKVPKCPDQTGYKPPTRINANTAHQEKDVSLGELFLPARLGVWHSPHQAAAGLLGWGSQGACTAQHTWDINISHKLCPFRFFSFSPYSHVTVRVTLQYQAVYHHWEPRLTPLEENQRKQQGLRCDGKEANSSLWEAYVLLLIYPIHTHTQAHISGCSPSPHQSLLSAWRVPALLPFLCSDSCLVSMDFCVSSLKDIRWNGHIYGMTNILKAGGAIIVIQKPPIFAALRCHPVILCFALLSYQLLSTITLGCSSSRAVCRGLIEGHLCSQQCRFGSPQHKETWEFLAVIIHLLHESWEHIERKKFCVCT